MRSALIGIGVIGKVHAQILADTGRLAAICDIDPSLKELYPDVPFYTDYKEMLRRERPDAVHICTPHYLHCEMVLFALAEGIPVLCEKPLCISPEELDRILAAEKESRVPLGVCQQNRYNPESVFVKEYLKDKKVLAGVGQVAWKRDAAYYASAAWRGRWATEGGGVLINQALHTLDLLQYFAGMPAEIVAQVSDLKLKDAIEVEDTAVILSTDGAPLTFFATNGCSRTMPVEITLRTETEIIKILPGRVWINNAEQPVKEATEKARGKACYGSGHDRLIEDYYRCLAEGRPFPINGEAAANVLRLIFAAYRSGGKPVEV